LGHTLSRLKHKFTNARTCSLLPASIFGNRPTVVALKPWKCKKVCHDQNSG